MQKAVQRGLAALAILGAAAVAGAATPTGKAPAAAPAVEVPVIENAGYTFCANEGNDAMSLGRQVMVFKRTREQIDADPNVPPYVRGIAADFFRALEGGQVESYAHFATRRMLQCLDNQKVKLDMAPDRVFSCVTRLDIPYFYFVMSRAGQPREEGIRKLETGLAGWQYPSGLVAALAEPGYQARTLDDVRELQMFVLSACLLPPEQVARFYGMAPPTGAPAPAPAAGAPAKAPRASGGGK